MREDGARNYSPSVVGSSELVTEHGIVTGFRHRIGKSKESNCVDGNQETPIDCICECLALLPIKQKGFGVWVLIAPEDIKEYKIGLVLEDCPQTRNSIYEEADRNSVQWL